jgi:phosphoenolpyruvate carboxylase
VHDGSLHDEIGMLGTLLDDVVADLEGAAALTRVQRFRQLAQRRREGDDDAGSALASAVRDLPDSGAAIVARAFTTFFDLANLAEDRQRVRVLRRRERERFPAPPAESIGDAVRQLQARGLTAEGMQALLDRFRLEPVFTAHPTEARRRTIREKLRDLRTTLEALDVADILPRERQDLLDRLRGDLTMLWLTDILRERRPTVLEELDRSLFFYTTLWQVVPRLYRELQQALAATYPGHPFDVPVFLRFGSWIGGDRDGNPFVTTPVTTAALARLQDEAVRYHVTHCRALRRTLGVSSERAHVGDALRRALDTACARWPEAQACANVIAPADTCRRWLRVVQWRLEQTRTRTPGQDAADGAYPHGSDLLADLDLLRASLVGAVGGDRLVAPLDDWMWQVRVFGFHVARLDVRQESRRYRQVMTELLRALGRDVDMETCDEDTRVRLLSDTMDCAETFAQGLSPETADAIALFRLLARIVHRGGAEALGVHVISMTRAPSDVLIVLWLSRWAARLEGLADDTLLMPIAPLFETIADLEHAPAILDRLLQHPDYVRQLARDDRRQCIMIGYSDSTKDGGYLAACWMTYRAQLELQAVADRHRVRTTFFHGRGGSLGRGGGPAARSILSLPSHAVGGAVRITEQGEVLAERYDTPAIAHRHLEQLAWATLLVSAGTHAEPDPSWVAIMRTLAETSLQAYRALVQQPGFIQYFVEATPIEEIETLPIGSRPSRRSGERTLADLRAIPWVFSWTQNRHLIPAWYGLGTAVEAFVASGADHLEQLRTLYREWPFFTAALDNAALALAKADLGIGQQYAALVTDAEVGGGIWDRIVAEHRRSVDGVLRVTGRSALLADVPWLAESIAVRNPSVDPLNIIQIEQLRRLRTARAGGSVDDAALEAARTRARLTIQGIAAGLRTTG